VFALEQRLKRLSTKGSGLAETPTLSSTEIELDAETRDDILADVDVASDATVADDPTEGYVKQAKQIVTGDQFSQVSLEYLIVALRSACDTTPTSSPKIGPRDILRIERVRDALRHAKDDRPA